MHIFLFAYHMLSFIHLNLIYFPVLYSKYIPEANIFNDRRSFLIVHGMLFKWSLQMPRCHCAAVAPYRLKSESFKNLCSWHCLPCFWRSVSETYFPNKLVFSKTNTNHNIRTYQNCNQVSRKRCLVSWTRTFFLRAVSWEGQSAGGGVWSLVLK